nr:Hsp70 family protein [Nocardioidaceae bacterium]
RGIPQIEVTFDIDANGIVHVSAKDRGTSREQSMTITSGSALSKEEIDKMIADAEQYAEEDRQRKEAVETRNQADSAVYSTETFLRENSDKIPADLKTEVEVDIAEVKKALEGEDVSEISAAASKLATSSQKMGAAMYAASADDASAAESTDQASSNDDGIVDAEIVDEPADTSSESDGSDTGAESSSGGENR